MVSERKKVTGNWDNIHKDNFFDEAEKKDRKEAHEKQSYEEDDFRF
jgi:hypothetical protein